MTPGVEFYDLFDPSHTGFAQEDLYKMTDNKGRLLVMRPDCTLPIARLAATRLQALPRPLRLWYDEMVYRNNPGLDGRDDEQLQCGMELLGAGGLKADLEALFLASRILQDMVPGYRIELGHAGIFQGLSEELPVDDEGREAIRRAIEAKNYAALSAMLDEIPDTPAVQALQKLPRLFGGPEVLHEARALCGGSRASEALSYLQNLYEKLCDLGLSDHVMFDLGLVQRNDYYTGVVFSAYIPGEGGSRAVRRAVRQFARLVRAAHARRGLCPQNRRRSPQPDARTGNRVPGASAIGIRRKRAGNQSAFVYAR